MDRKNLNVGFSMKMCENQDNGLDNCDHNNLYKHMRITGASGGDVAIPNEGIHHNSKTSILSCYSQHSNEQFDDVESINKSVRVASIHSQKENVEVIRNTNLESQQSNALQAIVGVNPNGNNIVKNLTTNQTAEVGNKLKTELSKYKKELKEYNNTTKDLEEKYKKINFELSEMQEKHDRFVASRRATTTTTTTTTTNESDSYTDSSSSHISAIASASGSDTGSGSGSEYSLKRKYAQVFNRNNGTLGIVLTNKETRPLPKHRASYFKDDEKPQQHNSNVRSLRKKSDNTHSETLKRATTKRKMNESKENEPPMEPIVALQTLQTQLQHQQQVMSANQAASLKDIYKVLKTVLDTSQKSHQSHQKNVDLKELQNTISSLQTEQVQFRNIIQQQQTCLNDYHTRCVKAQHIMQTQQREIEKLNNNNHQLETEISDGIQRLRSRIDVKLKDVSHLPQLMRNEQTKCEKVTKENNLLTERLAKLQNEAANLKMRIEELGRRKNMTLNRLKATERDLKIFKNYNTALKHEKRKLSDELMKAKQQLEAVQNNNKRNLARQREQSENKRRELQKRVFELELRLSRSQNSTTNLIQERDSLIAELQTQLNTLVHNFEVSQKHIRVLRRHIYQMTGGTNRNNNNNNNSNNISSNINTTNSRIIAETA